MTRFPKLNRFTTDERGAVAIMMVLWMLGMTGFCCLVVDFGQVFMAKRVLQSSTESAALAGAANINVGSGGTAISMATSYGGATGGKNADPRFSIAMASGYPQLKCFTSTGVSCAGPDSANGIVVRQTMTVPLVFGKLFGVSNVTFSATATASGRGGGQQLLDVMLVLDTTQSMNNADSSCSGATRLACAEAGVRAMLGSLQPCSASLSNCGTVTNGNVANAVAEVGLMVFPPVTAPSVSTEYDCSGTTQPTVSKYSAPSPVYQILALSSDYRTSATASLSTSSNLVRAVGGGGTGCSAGLTAVGGVGTFYADAITAAQNALTTNGRANATKVIVFLGDGDASASSQNMTSTKVNNQCRQAITAAAAATAAGTRVYTIAYGASNSASSSCSTDSPSISACATLQQIASDSTKFFSDTVGGTSACGSSANSVSALTSIFTAIANDLSFPRLIPDNTT